MKTKDENGNITIELEGKKLIIANDGEIKGFIRHGVRMGGEHSKWLVGELDGVRAYVIDDTVVLTKQDIKP